MPARDTRETHRSLISLSLAEIAAWQVHGLIAPTFAVDPQPRCVAWLPALQRGAVWKQSQVELLWDSLLRQFPVGALVLTPLLEGQSERLGQHADERWVKDLSATHHLLDGQQRANAIALGFYDPFHPEVGQEPRDQDRAILWLDLASPSDRSTRTYLFRLTTMAHPWGFEANDAASKLSAKNMREALAEYGWREKDGKTLIKEGRLPPRNAWPFDAGTPIPFAWLLQAAARTRSVEGAIRKNEVIRELLERCSAEKLPWCTRVIERLRQPAGLESLVTALQHALTTQIPVFVLRDEALADNPGQSGAEGQSIAAVEHLFQRLNAGGTVPSRENLTYSMIKAYWPEVEQPIRLLSDRHMPESKLFVLGARLALGETGRLDRDPRSLPRRLPAARDLEAIRRIALDKENEGTDGERIYNFFVPKLAETTSLSELHAVMAQVTGWLEHHPDGLPSFLHGSVAQSSPDAYLLLMWLARHWASRSAAQPDNAPIRRSILGLVTAIHWFPPKKLGLATQLIAQELDQRDWNPDIFRGILSAVARQDENPSGLQLPLKPEEVSAVIGDIPGQKELPGWAWWKLGRDVQNNETRETRSINIIQSSRELLLYAQRAYTREKFVFNPAHASSDQHDRPWDYDHILPSNKLSYVQRDTRPGLQQWMDSIANLRVWPMEDNRSDRDDCPRTKIAKADDIIDSYLTLEQLEAFDRGCQDPFNPGNAEALLVAAKERLLRIYREWYCTLQIGVLTDNNEDRPIPCSDGLAA